MKMSRWRRKTALLIAGLALVWIGIAVVAATTPCSCEELTVSGAGKAAINGAYMYESFITTYSYYEGTDMWLGPFFMKMGGYDLNWAVVRLGGGWVAGVVALFDGTEHVIFYVPDGTYLNYRNTKCPPETGWRVSGGGDPAPTIARDGCLCAGIGDVNDDGYYDLLDARLLHAHVSGFSSLPAEMLYRADVDDDGDVDLDDFRILSEQLIGICP